MLPLLVAILGPVMVLVANRVLAYKAARKRARAGILREDAEALLQDGDPSNDAEARILLRDARELDAGADALEGLNDRRK